MTGSDVDARLLEMIAVDEAEARHSEGEGSGPWPYRGRLISLVAKSASRGCTRKPTTRCVVLTVKSGKRRSAKGDLHFVGM